LGRDFTLPLPHATRVRSPRSVEAAILYIYGDPTTGERVTDIVELSKRVPGSKAKELRAIRREDRWDEFRLEMIAREIQEKKASGDMPLVGRKRTPLEMEAILGENARQQAEIPKLKDEAEKLMERIAETEPSDRSYSAMVVSLGRVTEMLNIRTGKAEYEQEIAEGRRALLKMASAQKQQPKDHSVDIVMDELPMLE